MNVPAELQALDARLAALGLPANHPLRAPIPQLLGAYSALQAGTQVQGANALATLPVAPGRWCSPTPMPAR